MSDPGDETTFHDVAGANVHLKPMDTSGHPLTPESVTLAVLGDVAVERARQDAKWGEQNHTALYWYAVLGEEYGEVGEALLDYVDEPGGGVAHEDHYREELIHVAAVAVATIETLDRIRARRAAIINRMPPAEADAWRSIYAHADELARQQREAGR